MTEYLDIVDENGTPTGEIISRDSAHRDGILHRTAHVWVIRESEGKLQILLQKRSMEKESSFLENREVSDRSIKYNFAALHICCSLSSHLTS